MLADHGFEIVHVRFHQPIALSSGFERIRDYLVTVQRPVQALCAIELRSPRPFTFQGFNDFNANYIRVLTDWGVLADNINPIARTNIAPEIFAPTTPSMYGFSYTMPSRTKAKTFVVAGAGELPEGSLDPHDVVRRGEWEVSVGFIRTEEGRIEKTPDRQVQQAIATVFQKFHQLGSARQATIWFREEQIPLPHVKGGTAGKEVFWALPSSGRILQILRNPCYGGAFAYGKTAPRTVIEDGRARQQSRYRKPQNEWKVLLIDHHPGYISWEEYLENQRRLEANVAWGDGEGSGAAKSGTAMLSGLLRCGRCGRKLQVVYSGKCGRVPRYNCRGDRGNRGSSPCLTIGSLRVDRAVIHSVLAAIQPAGIEAAVKVSECAEAEDGEKRKALELALERASITVLKKNNLM